MASVALWSDGRRLEAGAGGAGFSRGQRGVFETLRCERGALFLVAEHLARLEHGARTLGLPWPPPWDPRAALADSLAAVEPRAAALRLTYAFAGGRPLLLVEARALDAFSEPLDLWVAPSASRAGEGSGIKSIERAVYQRWRAEARRRGAWEALLRGAAGDLVEGTVTNLFLARDGELATPPCSAGALPGILRAVVLAELEREPLTDERGLLWRPRERRLDLEDLRGAEEILLTNSLLRVAAARIVGSGGTGTAGPVARALRRRMLAVERAARWSGEA